MRVTWKRAGLGLVALVTAVALVVVSGVVPIGASSEHWPITRWFMSFAMARSVSTYSLGVDAPRLDEPSLVLRGAGHYEIGCVPCHGRPGLGPSEIIREMTPHPPVLMEAVAHWSPEELYRIVRHGVKFTGMPAWPVENREDEVWAVVAFLRVLPELDEAEYLRLVYGAGAAGDRGAAAGAERPARSALGFATPPIEDGVSAVVRRSCGSCHGVEGRGRGFGAFPSLAGQRRAYLENSLAAFRDGQRTSGTMHAVASGLPPSLIVELASYYASRGDAEAHLLTAAPDSAVLIWSRSDTGASSGRESGASIERGEVIASQGMPRPGIPSCASCHGPGQHPRNPAYPLLAGQYFEYLVGQLRLFRSGVRGGTDYQDLMHEAVRELEEAELLDLAAYYAALGEGRR